MTTSRDLADAALAAAQQFLTAQRGQLTALAAGDREALIQAQLLVRSSQAGHPETQRAAEHIAYTLLMLAWSETTRIARGDV